MGPPQLNKAPDGYGLGTDCKVVEGFETITENGWYAVLHHDAPDLGGWWIGIYTRYRSLGNILAFRNGHIVHKKRYYDEWGPWEWVNPPMSVGVEYRTVERYMGKPVYTKLVDFGELPLAGAHKAIAHGIIMNNAITMELVAKSPLVTSLNGHAFVDRAWVTDVNLHVVTAPEYDGKGEGGTLYAHALIKYTKIDD